MFAEAMPADDSETVADSLVDFITDNIDDHPIFMAERFDEIEAAGFRYAPARIGPTRLSRVLK